MPTPRPALNLVVAACCAGLLVASLVGVAVVSDDTDLTSASDSTRPDENGDVVPTLPADPGAAGATTTVAGGGGGAGQDGGGQGGVGGGGAATTAPGGPAAPPPADALPKRLAPPKAGTYRYDTTLNGRATKPENRKVETQSTAGGTTKQTITSSGTQRGVEITIIAEVSWTSAAATVTRTIFQVAGGTANCDWNPDFAEYVGDMAVGKEWRFDSSCSGSVEGGQLNGQNYRMKRVVKKTVAGAKQETVAGTTVPTWTLQFDEHLEFDIATFKTVIDSVGTEQFAAELGVPVAEERTTKTSSPPDQPSTSKFTRRIQNLNPQ